MNPIKLTFLIHLDAEYHSGSGRRAGAEIDSGLLRDEEKSPVLRGTLLAGLLRDGLRDFVKLRPVHGLEKEVLLGTKLKEGNKWGAEARLFGAAHLRKRWHYSSARPENPAHQDYWNVQPVARISIDRRTRRARQQALFTQEEGDRRLKFIFTVTCHAGDEQDQLDALLLVAASRTVRHLGSARRRGRGACRFELVKTEGLPEVGAAAQVDALNAFRKHWLNASVANAKSHSTAPRTNGTAAALTAEQVAKFEAELLKETTAPVRFKTFVRFDEPVLIAQSAQLANAFLTRNDVPGGVLLGAFAALAAKTLKLQPFDRKDFYQPAPLEFIRLFMRGGVLCSGLSPAKLTETGQRFHLGLPIPLDHYVCEKYPKYNKKIREPHPLAVSTLNDGTLKSDQCGCDGKRSRIGEPWLALTSQPFGFEPARREEAHIKMDPDLGRVEEGNLFEYIPLEAGQFYAGELVFKTENDWLEFQRLTDLHEGRAETIHLGKAAQRGYGKSALYLQRCDDKDKPSAMLPRKIAERFSQSEVRKNGFRLLLLTEAIIADSWGRYYHSFDAAWIAELFDLKPEHIEYDGIEGLHDELHGFHGQRRMPRWRDHVISAGSCIGIKITREGWQQLKQNAWRDREASSGVGEENEPPPTPTANGNEPEAMADDSPGFSWLLKRLEYLENHGIGLRRHEGFGRVVFNHPIYGNDPEKFEIDWELPHHDLYYKRGKDSLHDEFKKRWSSKLDKIARKLDAQSLPVAQTIYLRRFQSKENLEAALKRLLKPDAGYLWKKKLELRETKSKIKLDGSVMELRQTESEIELRGSAIELINELWKDVKQDHDDPRWPEGLAMLAERIAENAGE